ncbi:tunicamycin induced protein [Carex rostrata]
MEIRFQFLAILLAFIAFQAYSSSALISSETLTPPSPKAITDLKDAIVKGLGLQSDLKVSGFDVRDALVGKAVAYEFVIEIGKKMIPVKLLEDVSRWDFVDLPFFHRMNGGNEAKEGNSLAKMGKKKDSIDLPELPPFQLAGPMELWIQDGDDMRLAIPHDVEAGKLKKVVLSDGAVVTVKGARSVSLRHPIELPLPFNRSVMGQPHLATGLLSLAQALRDAYKSNSEKPLLSLHIVGPSSLTSSPSTSPNDRLQLKRLAPGLVKLSSRTPLPSPDSDNESQPATMWPMTSINGSNSNLRGFEELLASVLGEKGQEEGSFRLVEAQVSAQTYVKMGFEIEKKLLEGEANWDKYPEWRTRPQKSRAHFEVLARVEEGGKIVPERIVPVQPFEVKESVTASVATGNVSMSKVETVHTAPDFFTL